MINLNIGKALYSILSNANIGVTKIVPCVAEAETQLPYAVYQRMTANSEDSKDIRCNIHKASFTISVYSDSYDNSLSIAQTIVTKLDGCRGNIKGCNIQSTKVTDAGEAWVNDAYCQSIDIEFKYV